MNTRLHKELSTMVEKLVEEFSPKTIYLFGSRARGDHHGDSDYDILIVLPDLKMPARKYAQKAYQLLWGIGPTKDIVFTSEQRFEGLKNVVNSVEEAAFSEGKVLYVRE